LEALEDIEALAVAVVDEAGAGEWVAGIIGPAAVGEDSEEDMAPRLGWAVLTEVVAVAVMEVAVTAAEDLRAGGKCLRRSLSHCAALLDSMCHYRPEAENQKSQKKTDTYFLHSLFGNA